VLEIAYDGLLAAWIVTPILFIIGRPYSKRRLTLGELMLGIAVLAVILGVLSQARWISPAWVFAAILLLFFSPIVLVARHVPARWEVPFVIIWSLPWLALARSLLGCILIHPESWD
jgi:hypothetical protein